MITTGAMYPYTPNRRVTQDRAEADRTSARRAGVRTRLSAIALPKQTFDVGLGLGGCGVNYRRRADTGRFPE